MTGAATWLAVAALSVAAGDDAGLKGPVVVTDPSSPSGEARRLGLFIGVAGFDDDGWPDLRFPADDARSLAQRLESQGAFETTVLVSQERTSRAAFVEALDRLASGNQRRNDTVMVYVSTHGTLARDPAGHLQQVLVFRDTDHDNPLESGLLVGDLVRRFEALSSRRKVLVLATCYSGTGKSSLSHAVKSYLTGSKGALAPPLYDVSSATVILSASAWGETAREDEKLGHDVYTHFFLEALHGYDPNGDGATSVVEAHDFARRETYRFSGGRQRPTAMMTIEGEDPIVLAGERRVRGKPVLLSYRTGFEGYQVLVDGAAKGALPGGIVVEPGWHEVALAKPAGAGPGEEVMRRRVHVSPGERVDVGDLYDRESPLQVEATGGLWLRPGSEHGSTAVLLGSVGGLVRRQELLPLDLDLSVVLEVARGSDTLRVNRQRFGVTIQEVEARVGVGTHLTAGPLVFHFDGWGGAGYARRTVDSRFYEEPRGGFIGLGAVSATLRWRFLRILSIGGGVQTCYRFGTPHGFGGSVWLSIGVSP